MALKRRQRAYQIARQPGSVRDRRVNIARLGLAIGKRIIPYGARTIHVLKDRRQKGHQGRQPVDDSPCHQRRSYPPKSHGHAPSKLSKGSPAHASAPRGPGHRESHGVRPAAGHPGRNRAHPSEWRGATDGCTVSDGSSADTGRPETSPWYDLPKLGGLGTSAGQFISTRRIVAMVCRHQVSRRAKHISQRASEESLESKT